MYGILALLVVVPPPSGETVRASVTAAGNFIFASDSTGATIVQAGGGVDATVYLGSSVIDDETPISLQPFLQRRSGIEISGGGTGLSGSSSDATRSVGGSDSVAALDVFGYPSGGPVYAFGDVGAEYTTTDAVLMGQTVSSQSELILPLRAGIGWRTGDVLVDLSWGVAPFRVNDGAFSVPDWYGARLRLRALVLRREWVAAQAAFIHRGGSGQLAYEHFFGRDFSLSVTAGAGHGAYIDSGHPYTFVGGTLGTTLWFTTRFNIACSYGPTWTRTITSITDSITQHSFAFGFGGRI